MNRRIARIIQIGDETEMRNPIPYRVQKENEKFFPLEMWFDRLAFQLNTIGHDYA